MSKIYGIPEGLEVFETFFNHGDIDVLIRSANEPKGDYKYMIHAEVYFKIDGERKQQNYIMSWQDPIIIEVKRTLYAFFTGAMIEGRDKYTEDGIVYKLGKVSRARSEKK